MQIKAAVLYGYNKPYSVETVELDPPKRGEVLVKIGAAGVCRSDLHFQRGEAAIGMPAVLGHEGSGTVVEVGEGVTLTKPGQRVFLSFVSNCGQCHFCLTGRPHLCDTHAKAGAKLFDGTSRLHTNSGEDMYHMGKVACFAEYAVVPEQACIPAPDYVDFPQMALIGCSVTTGVGAALFNGGVKPGDSVVVVGVGGVGLNILQGAKLAGATTIVAVDVKESALDFAKQFGATHTVNAHDEGALKLIREITDGGADVAFESFGGAETSEMAINASRKGGTAVLVGIAPMDDVAKIEPVNITRLEKTIKGCYYGSAKPREDMPRIADWYHKGLLNIDGLVTRRYSLDDINRAYDDIESNMVGRGVIAF